MSASPLHRRLASCAIAFALAVASGAGVAGQKKEKPAKPKPATAASLKKENQSKGSKVQEEPQFCSSVYVLDNNTGKVLWQYGEDLMVPLASLSKIPTALANLLEMEQGLLPTSMELTVPDRLTSRQFARFESCSSPTFSGRPTIIPRMDAIIASIFTSHNPVTYWLGQDISKYHPKRDFDLAVYDMLRAYSLDVADISFKRSDPTGMSSARDCKDVNQDSGNTGKLSTMATMWNILVSKIGTKAVDLQQKEIPFLDGNIQNTNPFIGRYPGVTVIGKTALAHRVRNYVGTATTANGYNITFGMACNAPIARIRMGDIIIKNYILNRPPLNESLDNHGVSSNSQRVVPQITPTPYD